MNRALVLSGGGAKGAFQIAAVSHLVNGLGLTFQVIAGVSTGALNAAMLAAGPIKQQCAKVIALYRSLRGNGDVYHMRFPPYLGAAWQSSLYDPAPIRAKLNEYVSHAALVASGVQLRIGATGLQSGQYRAVTETDPNVVAFAMASASMPVAFPPVEIEGDRWVDGGVRHIEPLKDAFTALKALSTTDDTLELYLVLCDPLPGFGVVPRQFGTVLEIGARALDLLTNQVLLDDLRVAVAYNQQARAAAPTTAKRAVTLYVVAPDESYMATLSFDPTAIREAIVGGLNSTPMTEAQFAPLIAAGET